jgi:hypothetical protein
MGGQVQGSLAGVVGQARPSNNGMQLTKAAGCAPRPSLMGQSLRAAFAADPEC